MSNICTLFNVVVGGSVLEERLDDWQEPRMEDDAGLDMFVFKVLQNNEVDSVDSSASKLRVNDLSSLL